MRQSDLANAVYVILKRERNLRDSLIQIAVAILRARTEDPTSTRLLLYSALERHALSGQFLHLYIASLTTALAKHFRKHMESGTIRSGNAAVIAQSFLGMLTHYIFLHTLFRLKRIRSRNLEAIGAEIVDLWLNGVLPLDCGNGESGVQTQGSGSERNLKMYGR
jgi:hypothetical protein